MFETLTQICLPIALILIMTGVGMTLRPANFTEVVRQPKAFFVGALAQLLLLPVTALLVIYLFDLQAELAVGLFILALCPGGTTSNLYSYLAKADVGLSVALTALVGFVTPFSLPLLAAWAIELFLGENTSFQLPLLKTWLTLMLVGVLPVLLGMWFNFKWPEASARLQPLISRFSVIVLVLLIISIATDLGADLWLFLQKTGPAALALNVLTMVAGYWAGRLLLRQEKQARTICLEVGLQNGTLALMITTGILQNSAMSIAPSVYSLLMFMTASVFTVWVLRKNKLQSSLV
ncbi:bile acid:sodium symporter family protein [Rheinheimera mesophila]|uniref:Bile acid:sodium symporter family protein n=1 Tax=Rheinheimera mesophila TaxID=1547515 RepID=A0A3P3QR71_9GAMM|nr:bile acid:sodium symporter family protein [Rheinheimera mesophila]KKL00370.1 Na+-dependent transporter [Rheinheimera mesophila]RRJ23766.1 bile acid:sodium symporter family protein [Rheinheimera mesophila]